MFQKDQRWKRYQLLFKTFIVKILPELPLCIKVTSIHLYHQWSFYLLLCINVFLLLKNHKRKENFKLNIVYLFCILATIFNFKEIPKNEQLRGLYDSKDDWYFINSIFLYLKEMNPDSGKNHLAKFLLHNTNFFNYLGLDNNCVKNIFWSNQRHFYVSTENERQTKENSPKTVKKLSEKPHKCHICFREFAHGSSLSNYLVIHKNDKVFQCRRCNSKFLRKSDLQKHKIIYGERKLFKCSICSQFDDSTNHQIC